jgi:hypothetical protein
VNDNDYTHAYVAGKGAGHEDHATPQRRCIPPTEPRFRLIRVAIPDGDDHYILQDTCGHWHINEAQAATVEETLNQLSKEMEDGETPALLGLTVCVYPDRMDFRTRADEANSWEETKQALLRIGYEICRQLVEGSRKCPYAPRSA